MNKVLLIITPLLMFAGCQTTLDKVGYVKKDKLVEQIEIIKAENIRALDKKEAEIKSALNHVIDGKNAQIQAGVNSIWAADNAFKFYEAPQRLDIVINNRVREALAAFGLGPTLEAVQSENARLAKELDERLTSIDDLRATNETIVKKNAELVIETQSHLANLQKLESEKERIKQEGIEKLLNKQTELNSLNDKLIAQEKLNGEDKKYIEANKRLLMISLGLVSLGAIIVAIYLPLFRKESGYLAAITGGAALAIPFLQSWHINVALLLGLGYVAFLLIRKHSISHKTNENLINAVQEIKDSKPDLYKNEVRPLLEEWNKKYLKDGNKIEDKVVVKHIDEILRDYEKK